MSGDINSIDFSAYNMYEKKDVQFLKNEANNALFSYVEEKGEILDKELGLSDDKNASEHERMIQFLTHIDGALFEEHEWGYKHVSSTPDGVITNEEVEAWMKANGHSEDAFGGVANILEGIRGLFFAPVPTSESNGALSQETVNPQMTNAPDVSLSDEIKASAPSIMEINPDLLSHLQANIKYIGGQEGETLGLEHIKNFLTKNIDKNGDGKVTPEEVEIWLEANGHGEKFGRAQDLAKGFNSVLQEIQGGCPDCGSKYHSEHPTTSNVRDPIIR